MNGKGDKDRTSNRKAYNNNYDKITWSTERGTIKKFTTSWGAEYSITVDESKIESDTTPTINDLTNKS